MNEFNLARHYSVVDLKVIHSLFESAGEVNNRSFPCMGLDCDKCPFNTLKGRCGGTSTVIAEKYGKCPDWRAIHRRWEQAVIDSGADIEESEETDDETIDRIVIPLYEHDAKVLSEYIRRTNETLNVPTTMLAVSGYVKRLIDASLKHGNKDGD